MPRTKTTRDGEGKLFGSKGPGNGSPKAAPFGAGNKAAEGRPPPGKGSDAVKAQWLKDMLFKTAAEGELEVNRLRAAEAWLNRHEGTPIQKTQVTGPDGGPIASEVVYRWDTAKPE